MLQFGHSLKLQLGYLLLIRFSSILFFSRKKQFGLSYGRIAYCVGEATKAMVFG